MRCLIELLKYTYGKVLLIIDIRGSSLTQEDFDRIGEKHSNAMARIKDIESFRFNLFLIKQFFPKVEDIDVIEVECIVANLIYMGYIKGYISHQHQKLVVSKQNPFPALSSFL
ncbi:hypothetical protein ACROYT_G028187 [Oculina patagonica]